MAWLARLACLAGAATLSPAALAQSELVQTIAKVKASILVIGTYKATNNPRFTMRGTGFVVGDGTLVFTNAHVLPDPTEDPGAPSLVASVRRSTTEFQARPLTVLEVDSDHDLALLRMDGAPLPALSFRDSSTVREGQSVALMGFPIGGLLGFSPVTHRGMVSSITPIALPPPNSQQLNASAVRRLRGATFDIFQLDATAYPGNSGGPLFDPETAEVVGIINMGFLKAGRESALSQPSGITYAIPANFAIELLQKKR